MTTLAQGERNDISVDADGMLSMATGKSAYEQIVAAAIRTLTGELQLDVERGVPWMSTILAKKNRTEIWKHYVEKRVSDFDFVKRVKSFAAEYDAESRTVKFRIVLVSADDGDVTVEQTVFG